MSTTPKPKLPGAIRRKAVDLSQFNPVRETLLGEDQSLPLIMQPSAEHVDLTEWAAGNRDYIHKKLLVHGGILFRGFGLKSPADFERVVGAICNELYAEYGDLPREGVAGKIYTSTPYPSDKAILYHNESSHMERWPARISFFCVKAAEQGGKTPIADCRKVYRLLDPEIVRTFAHKGVMYVRNFAEGFDVSWRNFFHTDDKSVVERACKAASMTCEWTDNDGLRVRHVSRAVIRHPQTGEMSFFNQIQLHHVYCLEPAVRQSLFSLFKQEDLPRQVYYGDGSPIPDAVMEHVGEAYEKVAVRFAWQEGDLVTLDNMLTAHARDPYVGARKIVVAMGDMLESSAVEGTAALSQ